MTVTQKPKSKEARWREFVLILLVLGLAVWCAHLWKFQSFGLYEDDYHFAYDGWYRYSIELIADILTNWAEGRPLGWLLLVSLHKLGSFFGKLPAGYLIAYPILLTDAILFYYLLKRIFQSPLFALSGALGLTLFPGHTTQIFLTHAYLEAIAILCLILSFYCFILEKKVLAYFFAALILFIYETPYPVFLAAPLLIQKQSLKKWLKHLVISGLILAGYFLARSILMGDARVQNLLSEPSHHLFNILRGLYIGPKVSLTSFFWSTNYVLTHWQNNLFIVSLISSLLFFVIYLFIINNTPPARKGRNKNIELRRSSISINGNIKLSPDVIFHLKLILIAIFMVVLSYGFSVTRLPNIRAGKTTSSHIGATVPFGIIFGSVLYLIGQGFKRLKLPAISAAIIALIFAGLFSYRWLIMEDFAKSWLYQRWYFTQVVALCPDLSEDKILIVQPVNQYEETFINTYNMVSNIIVSKMLTPIPTNNYLLLLDNPDRYKIIRVQDEVFYVSDDHRRVIPFEEYDLIVLRFENGLMIRERGLIEIAGMTYEALPFPENPQPKYELSNFGQILFDPALAGQPLPSKLLEGK